MYIARIETSFLDITLGEIKYERSSIVRKESIGNGKEKGISVKLGKIVAEGDHDYMIVKLNCGRRAWIKKLDIFYL